MKYSSLDNLAKTLSFCILKKGKIENFGHVLQHVSACIYILIMMDKCRKVSNMRFSLIATLSSFKKEKERCDFITKH